MAGRGAGAASQARLLFADENRVATAQVARVFGACQVGHQLQVISVAVDKASHRNNLRGKRANTVKYSLTRARVSVWADLRRVYRHPSFGTGQTPVIPKNT